MCHRFRKFHWVPTHFSLPRKKTGMRKQNGQNEPTKSPAIKRDLVGRKTKGKIRWFSEGIREKHTEGPYSGSPLWTTRLNLEWSPHKLKGVRAAGINQGKWTPTPTIFESSEDLGGSPQIWGRSETHRSTKFHQIVEETLARVFSIAFRQTEIGPPTTKASHSPFQVLLFSIPIPSGQKKSILKSQSTQCWKSS